MLKTEVSPNGKKDKAVVVKKNVIQATSYDAPQLKNVTIEIEGLTPFLSNRKHEGISLDFRDKTEGRKKKRDIIDPEKMWELCVYRNGGGQPCIPGIMFKKSMVNTAVFFADDKSFKRKLNGSMFVTEEMLPLKFSEEIKRCDFLRLKMGGGHNSYRREYKKWSVTLPVQFNANVFSANEIVSILNTAGFSVGVGDHRPERGGTFGRFKIK